MKKALFFLTILLIILNGCEFREMYVEPATISIDSYSIVDNKTIINFTIENPNAFEIDVTYKIIVEDGTIVPYTYNCYYFIGLKKYILEVSGAWPTVTSEIISTKAAYTNRNHTEYIP